MKSKENTFRIIAAILFALAALNQLIVLVTIIINQAEYMARFANISEVFRLLENLSYTFIPLILLIAVAVMLFLGKDKVLTYGLIAVSGLFLIFQFKRSFGNLSYLGSDIYTFFRVMNYILLPLGTAVLLLGMTICSAFLKDKVPAFIPMICGIVSGVFMFFYDFNYVVMSFDSGFLARAIGKYSSYTDSFYQVELSDYIYFIADILFYLTLALSLAMLGVYLTKRMKSDTKQ